MVLFSLIIIVTNVTLYTLQKQITRYIFSPSLLMNKLFIIFVPVAGPDLHTNPRGLVTRLFFLKRLPVFPPPLAAPAFVSLRCSSLRRLTFLLDETIETKKNWKD